MSDHLPTGPATREGRRAQPAKRHPGETCCHPARYGEECVPNESVDIRRSQLPSSPKRRGVTIGCLYCRRPCVS